MIVVSSFGCYDAVAHRFAAMCVDEEVCISLLGVDGSCGGEGASADGMKVLQRLQHTPPVNLVWSENSAHLVVIAAEFIYLYECVEGSDQQRWNWRLQRTVESPRDLTQCHAGYSHPLLSLEHTSHSHAPADADCAPPSPGNSELVVINLMCSLFQSFSIARFHHSAGNQSQSHESAGETTAENTFVGAARAAERSSQQCTTNRLSYSGRYLTTTQVLSSSQSYQAAMMGIRVYDLLDLWVLTTPTEASYLDFKYADLPIQVQPAPSPITTVATVPQWEVQQLCWRHSDAHSMSSDACELFFVSQWQRSAHSSVKPVLPHRTPSIGIADTAHTAEAEILTNEAFLAESTPSSGAYSDVTVSIYCVSQQPDYENIAIMTMAYNAAIVAGQLNQDDGYGTLAGANNTLSQANSADNLSGLVTPSYSAHNQPFTTRVHLLTVVSLSALLQEIPVTADVSPLSVSQSKLAQAFFCWVEPSHTVQTKHSALVAGTSLQPRAGKNGSVAAVRGGDASLQLAVQYSLAGSASAFLPFAVKHQPCSQSAYLPVCLHHGNVQTTTAASGVTDGLILENMRCWKGNSAVFTFLQQRAGDDLSLLAAARFQVNGAVPAQDSVAAAMICTDWRTMLVQDSAKPDRVRGTAVQLALLPSSNVQLRLLGKSGTDFLVRSASGGETEATWSDGVYTISLTPLLARARKDGSKLGVTVLSAVRGVRTKTTQYMYILYNISTGENGEDAGGYHIAVFAFDNTAWQGTVQAIDAAHATIEEANLAAHSNITAPWRQQVPQKSASQSVGTSTRSADSTVEFTVQILPDPHFGLGIRIDVLNGKTVVSSFKKHPITNKSMSAQAAGSIQPGDEFVAINGQLLRGLALSEVIHTIRTTVSEGGDSTVTLTMRRTTSTGTVITAPSVGSAGSPLPQLSAEQSVFMPDAGGLTRPPHLRNISGTGSLHGSASVNSLSDGLDSALRIDRARSVAEDIAGAGGDASTSANTRNMKESECGHGPLPLCLQWTLVSITPLRAEVCTADILRTPSSEPSTAAEKLLVVTVEQTAPTLAASTAALVITELSLPDPAPSPTALAEVSRLSLIGDVLTAPAVCRVQIWPSATSACGKKDDSDASRFVSSILVSPREAPKASPPRVADLIKLPELLLCEETSQTVLSLVPIVEAKDVLPPQQVTSSADWVLLDLPHQASGSLRLKCREARMTAVMRYHDLSERVPHYLPAASALQCSLTQMEQTELTQTLNPLSMIAELLGALSPHGESVSIDAIVQRHAATKLLQSEVMSSGASGVWVAGPETWLLSPLAEEVVTALQPLVSVHPRSPGSTSAVSALAQWCTEQRIDVYGQRALMIHLLTTSTTPRNAEDSARYLPAAVVANLMSADTVTQNAVLRAFLSPRGTEGIATSTTTSTATTLGLPSALSALSFVTSAESDILTTLKLTHAALWLRDLSPLADIIQKHALSTFRRTKSSIQIFLEMVLVGKEDTLLQLAKTDKEKSGRQLLALLTLDDSYSSEKTRKSLQKNAFALMKLHRYRDAAAVFLLADPPFIKEACSVLNRQFSDPMLALLVTRLAEYRQGQRRHAAMLAMAASSCVTTPASISAATARSVSQDPSPMILSSVEGYSLGAATRALLQNDVVPSLLIACQRTSLRSVQQRQREQQSSAVEEVAPVYAAVRTADALLLALVCALWLQNRGVLGDTMRALCGRYSLVDACTAASGEDNGVVIATISVLGSADWMLHISAFIGADAYQTALQSVQEFLTLGALQEHVLTLNNAYSTPDAVARITAQVKRNAFLNHCKACYTEHLRLQALGLQLLQMPSDSPSASLVGLSIPGTPTIMSAAATPRERVPVGSIESTCDTSVGVDEDAELASIMKRVARFQAGGVPGADTTVTAPASAMTSEATGGIGYIGAGAEAAPVRAAGGGGFNFSSSARPPTTKTTSNAAAFTAAAGNSGSTRTRVAPVNLLDDFDVPPPPSRRPPTSAGSSAPGRRAAGASLDLLGGDAPAALSEPPTAAVILAEASVETVRSSAARTEEGEASASEMHSASPVEDESASTSTRAASFNFSRPTGHSTAESSSPRTKLPAPVSALDAFDMPPPPTRRTQAGRPAAQHSGRQTGASLDLLGGDALDFPGPVRHTCPSSGTAAMPSAAVVNERGEAGADGSVDTTVAPAAESVEAPGPTASTSTDVLPATPVKAGFHFAARLPSASGNGGTVVAEKSALDIFDMPPAPVQRTTAETASSVRSDRRAGASLDLLEDALDFPQPVRHRRPATGAIIAGNASTSMRIAESPEEPTPGASKFSNSSAAEQNPTLTETSGVNAQTPSSAPTRAVRSALDDFDAFSVPVPRHIRAAAVADTTSTSSNTTSQGFASGQDTLAGQATDQSSATAPTNGSPS